MRDVRVHVHITQDGHYGKSDRWKTIKEFMVILIGVTGRRILFTNLIHNNVRLAEDIENSLGVFDSGVYYNITLRWLSTTEALFKKISIHTRYLTART